MSIFKGNKISVEIFGSSHAEKIGVICKGFPSMQIDFENLNNVMQKRRPSKNAFSTQRKETDSVTFTNGVDKGFTNGNWTAEIQNVDRKSGDYNNIYAKPRPSHADYSSYLKTSNLNFTGGGKFSGRMTAPLCIAGAIAMQYLSTLGVKIYSYLSQVGSVKGKSYKDGVDEKELENIKFSIEGGFPSLTKSQEMQTEIENAQKCGDSVGGICECVALNVPTGIGDAIFDGVEGKIANILYSIPAVKGVEFGSGFDLSNMLGSNANDELYFDGDKVKTFTNNSGGINGGITNGMPLTLRVAFKPTPSIYKTQKTVDLINKENVKIQINGRHDSCVAVRGVVVVQCAVAVALLDLILSEEK